MDRFESAREIAREFKQRRMDGNGSTDFDCHIIAFAAAGVNIDDIQTAQVILESPNCIFYPDSVKYLSGGRLRMVTNDIEIDGPNGLAAMLKSPVHVLDLNLASHERVESFLLITENRDTLGSHSICVSPECSDSRYVVFDALGKEQGKNLWTFLEMTEDIFSELQIPMFLHQGN